MNRPENRQKFPPSPHPASDRVVFLRGDETASKGMNLLTRHLSPGRHEVAARPGAAVSNPVIRLDNVSKTYRPQGGATVDALTDVSLDVASGEIGGIIGRSGAGKSTLVRLINGLEKPTSGRIIVDGVAISDLDEAQARPARRRIGMVFQHFNLLSSRTAAQNVALPLEIAGAERSAIKSRVDELLGLVGLSNERDRYPSELSGGQKQRVGIARALANKPSVLLSDEATSALDPETSAQILALLGRIRQELGVTIVLITHEMSVVKSIADRVTVLDGGRVVEDGPTYDIFANPQHATTRTFVGTVTGALLPDHVRAQIRDEPRSGDQAVVRITFSGPQAGQPVLSRLTQVLGIDINIVSGRIDTIAGQPFGTLIISVPADDTALHAVIAALGKLDLKAEVLGYVA